VRGKLFELFINSASEPIDGLAAVRTLRSIKAFVEASHSLKTL